MQRILKENKQLKTKIAHLRKTIKTFKHEKNSLTSRCNSLEEENNNLANLYVASYQLHSTRNFKEILKVILEIVGNLIGAKRCAILLVDEQSRCLVPKASEGIALDNIHTAKINNNGIINSVMTTGESYFKTTLSNKESKDLSSPVICIPLKIEDRVIGVVAVYSLLPHKKKLSNIDYELFNLLAGPTANAIRLSMLRAHSEGMFHTSESSLELYRGIALSCSEKTKRSADRILLNKVNPVRKDGAF